MFKQTPIFNNGTTLLSKPKQKSAMLTV